MFTAMIGRVGGRSAWFVGGLMLMVHLIFAMTLYRFPPQTHWEPVKESSRAARGRAEQRTCTQAYSEQCRRQNRAAQQILSGALQR